MKKILIIALVLVFAAPAFARRTDMMSSYGFSKKYKNSSQQKYNKQRYIYRENDDGDMYLSKPDRYMGDRYRSEAGRMLYENEHYRNYENRNRYLEERRRLDLEKRRLDIEKYRD